MTDIQSRKLPVLHWDEYEEKEYAVHPILKREPITSDDVRKQEKVTTTVMFAIFALLLVGAVACVILKSNHDACVLESSDGSCVTN
jgi:hypothetical protein